MQRPLLEATHEGEHCLDHGSLPITNSTNLFAFCATFSCNLGDDIGVDSGAGSMLQSTLSKSNVRYELFIGAIDLFAMVGALPTGAPADAPTNECFSRLMHHLLPMFQRTTSADVPTNYQRVLHLMHQRVNECFSRCSLRCTNECSS